MPLRCILNGIVTDWLVGFYDSYSTDIQLQASKGTMFFHPLPLKRTLSKCKSLLMTNLHHMQYPASQTYPILNSVV